MCEIKKATLGRLPAYLEYLNGLPETTEFVSSSSIAAGLGFGDVQVKKDLSAVCGKGRPKTGYKVSDLIADVKKALSKDKETEAVLVGFGKLGRAIGDYDGFKKFGLRISAVFDADPEKIGKTMGGKTILPLEKFKAFCENKGIKIGIITVPSTAAQKVCDLMTESGIKAIWNFAPAKITAGNDVIIKNEDLSLSLAYLNVCLDRANK